MFKNYIEIHFDNYINNIFGNNLKFISRDDLPSKYHTDHRCHDKCIIKFLDPGIKHRHLKYKHLKFKINTKFKDENNIYLDI